MIGAWLGPQLLRMAATVPSWRWSAVGACLLVLALTVLGVVLLAFRVMGDDQ